MSDFTARIEALERRILALEDKLRGVRTPPAIVASPGKRFTLNDHFNVADWNQTFARHTHTHFDTPMLFGSTAAGTQLETDGTVALLGDATTTLDIIVRPRTGHTSVGGPLVLAPFVGNILQYQLAINDVVDMEPIEFPHNWMPGSEIEFHIHWATGALNDATVRGVKWEVEYAYASAFGGIFSSTTVISTEAVIAAAEADRKLQYTTVSSFIPEENISIGTQLVLRVRRIAATGVAPTADPFGLTFGVHYLVDGFGSRSRFIK